MRRGPFFPAAVRAALLLLVITAVAFPSRRGEAAMSAHDIMEKNFFAIKVKTITCRSTMTLMNNAGGVRERTMKLAGKLQQNGVDTNLVIRFLQPADIEGTSFLQLERSEGDDNLWIFLPALHKSRRLVANNKKDSFFGSDFSYGDILPPTVNRYDHTLLRTETVDGHACSVIESKPKTETEKRNSGYSRKITWVRSDNFIESKVEYYDSDERLLKTQLVTGHTEVDRESRKWIAARREMTNHLMGHRTILVLDGIEVGKPIADEYFTVRTIEQE